MASNEYRSVKNALLVLSDILPVFPLSRVVNVGPFVEIDLLATSDAIASVGNN